MLYTHRDQSRNSSSALRLNVCLEVTKEGFSVAQTPEKKGRFCILEGAGQRGICFYPTSAGGTQETQRPEQQT